MNKKPLFADSCIFIGYAIDFEIFHKNCIVFFEKTDNDKYISESVNDELNRKIERRNALYKDYLRYLSRNKKEEYKPTIYLNDNDNRHMEELIYNLSKTAIIDQINYLRNLGKILKSRINKAKKTIKYIIPAINDPYFKDIIKVIVENDNDCRILNDAIQWSLEKNANIIFVTADGDIYDDRDKLLQRIMDYKYLDQPPINIIHITDFKV